MVELISSDAERISLVGHHRKLREVWKSFNSVLLSVGVVLTVAVSWCLGVQFRREALVVDPNHFNAPYAMMWFSTCFMILCYPLFLLGSLIFNRKKTIGEIHEDSLSLLRMDNVDLHVSICLYVVPFLGLWIGANYLFVLSLLTITPAVATSLSSCNAAMVYFLAIFILNDKFMIMKLLAVALAVAGVVVISMDQEMKIHWIGIVFSIGSAAFAAIYKVMFKKVLGSANLGQVSFFMSSLGFVNGTLNTIPTVCLILTGLETAHMSFLPWGPLMGSALLGLSFNFMINFGIALLNPLVISVGMLIGMPMNAAIDVLVHSYPLSWNFILGSILIIISFIMIVFPYDYIFEPKKKEEDEETIERANQASDNPPTSTDTATAKDTSSVSDVKTNETSNQSKI